MSRRVIILRKAESDARDAQEWYESQRAGLGNEFLAEIRRSIHVLAEYAERRPVYYRGFRRLLTYRFPYKLFYRIEGERVIVFRILHAKRDHRRHLDC